ncbi:hypothetical protein [Psychrobacillus soli]|nr:hypothetical protein [Psychrobacillus soli]
MDATKIQAALELTEEIYSSMGVLLLRRGIGFHIASSIVHAI